MKNAASSSPTVIQLERKLAAADAENAPLLALMEKKEAQWEVTKQSLFKQFRLALERQFGPSTEKYRVDQRDLLINEAEVAVDEEDASESDATAADATIDTATPVSVVHAAGVLRYRQSYSVSRSSRNCPMMLATATMTAPR
jgi:transposase